MQCYVTTIHWAGIVKVLIKSLGRDYEQAPLASTLAAICLGRSVGTSVGGLWCYRHSPRIALFSEVDGGRSELLRGSVLHLRPCGRSLHGLVCFSTSP